MARDVCPLQSDFGRLLDHFAHVLIPPARAYIRYAPAHTGKRFVWSRLVWPFLAWHAHSFTAATYFGSRVAGNTRDLIQQYIYYFGKWEPCLSLWLERTLKRGDTFVDVGANVGYFSLLASTLVGNTGRVVALEASPATFETLETNVALNRVDNVRAVNAAISDSESIVTLYRGHETNVGLATIVGHEASKHGLDMECEVRTISLDSVLRPEEFKTARVVKIDVEGAEWPVAAGMNELLRQGREDLEVMIEVDPERMKQHGKEPEDLIGMFAGAGFNAYKAENDYSAESYLAPASDMRPMRLRDDVLSETDLIFSRRDCESL